jgi:hypothetical protein
MLIGVAVRKVELDDFHARRQLPERSPQLSASGLSEFCAGNARVRVGCFSAGDDDDANGDVSSTDICHQTTGTESFIVRMRRNNH